MKLKIFTIVLFFAVFVNAQTSAKQNFQMLADSVNRDSNNTINACGNAIIYSQDYFLSADKIKYDRNNEVIELFGNVNLIYQNEVSKSEYIKLDLKNNINSSSDIFIMDKTSEVWAKNSSALMDEKYYTLKGSLVSSCNIKNPDWQIGFSTGKLNKQSKFLHLFNPVFYIGNVPVLYLPYFGFPMDKTRRTGLLLPEFGHSKSQGFYYKQPIYFAPSLRYDLQIDPQIRTSRGVGLYSTLRFADSLYSYGEISGGIFSNKKKYIEKYDYKNKINKGLQIYYDRNKILTYLFNNNYQENFLLDYKNTNDVSYFDLISKDEAYSDSLITSIMNYSLASPSNYFGMYMKYYINTNKLNNDYPFKNKDTLQEFPTLHYHKFLQNFDIFNTKLHYSLDFKIDNLYRKLGSSALIYNFNLPIGYDTFLFNDYLKFGIEQDLKLSQINYKDYYQYVNNKIVKKDSLFYANQSLKFSLSSELAKAYEKLFHTFNINLDYNLPIWQQGEIQPRIFSKYRYDFYKNRGFVDNSALKDLYDDLYYDNTFLSKFDDEDTFENLQLSLKQYFFRADGSKFIRHKAVQSYNIESNAAENFKHYVDFYLKNGLSFGNKFVYSNKRNNLEKVLTYAGVNQPMYSFYISHLYEDIDKKFNKEKDNFLILNASLKLIDNYKIFGALKYDMQHSFAKLFRVGFSYYKKCWNYTLAYQESIEPKTTNYTRLKSTKDKGIYFFVNLYPFGGLGYDYSKTIDYEDK